MDHLNVVNPSSLDLITQLPLHTSTEVEDMLESANSFFKDSSVWLDVSERIDSLEKFKTLILEEKHALILESLSEGGKPYSDTVGEFDRAVNGVELAIEHLQKEELVAIEMNRNKASANKEAYTLPEPCGLVLAISAFNHPINLVIHQVIPALAAGCPVIMKPALTTPLVARTLIGLLHQAGFPKEMCQYLLCGNEVTAELAQDKRLGFVSFIGSSKVGWELRSKLAPGVRCVLEHGGAAPLIVLDDFDEDKLISHTLKGVFYHAGQVCVSVQRLYIPSSKKEVINRMVEEAQKLKVGSAHLEETQVGPIITPEACDRIEAWVNEALLEGAQLLCGGKRSAPNYYEPTILLNPRVESKVSAEEVFGPVLCIYTYDDLSSAITQANALPYDFQAGVFSSDIEQAKEVAAQLKAMAVMINTHTAFRVDWMPFGGSSESGLGVGGISYSIDDMTKKKLYVIDHS